MFKKRFRRLLFPLVVLMLLLTLSSVAWAQGPDGPSNDELATSINIMWMLIAGFLVFFMQAGFALVETGFTRAKNVAHTMMMNLMVFCIGAIGYWLVGFAFQFGAVNFTYPAVGAFEAWAHSPVTLGDWGGLLATPLLRFGQFGILGGSGFMLNGLSLSTGILAFFMFQMVFMDTAATIPTGSMAERLKFIGFVLMGFMGSDVHLSARRRLGVGRRLAAEPGSECGLGQWRRGLCRFGGGAHDRRLHRPGRRYRHRAAYRSLQ